MSYLIVAIVLSGVSSAVRGWLGKRRGDRPNGFWLGLLLGPLGSLLICLGPD